MSFHDPRMARGSRWMGLAMAAGALVMLLDAPEPFSPWHFVVFLAFFVLGLMLAGGYLLLPSHAEREPPRPRADGAGAARGQVAIAPPTLLIPFVLAALAAAGLFVLGLYLSVAGTRLFRIGVLDLIPLAGVPLISGAALLFYLWRHRGVRIRADDEGLQRRGYWRVLEASWNDVEDLSVRQVWQPGTPARLYRIVTRRGTMTFYSTWPASEDLAATIAARSGLEWRDG